MKNFLKPNAILLRYPSDKGKCACILQMKTLWSIIVSNDCHGLERKEIDYLFSVKHIATLLGSAHQPHSFKTLPDTNSIFLTHNLPSLRTVLTHAYVRWLCPSYLALSLGHGWSIQARTADPSLANQNPSPGFSRLYYAKGLRTPLMVQESQ